MAMTEEAKAARRAYRRKWAKQNPDKVRAATEKYWQRKAEAAQDAQEKADELKVQEI